MSGRNQTDAHGEVRNAKAEKTRQALLHSLQGFVREQRYDQFDVADIVEDAAVGRSTFYDHYRGKDDMLVETMGHMLDVMAGVAGERDVAVELEGVLRHFQENGAFARHLFSSPSSRHVMDRITRALAHRIEEHLGRDASLAIPATWLARQLAESQFALVRSWLGDEGERTPRQVADAICAGARATVAALGSGSLRTRTAPGA